MLLYCGRNSGAGASRRAVTAFFRRVSGIKATTEFCMVQPFLETGNILPNSRRLPEVKTFHGIKNTIAYVSHG
jgi:hypothetical protein